VCDYQKLIYQRPGAFARFPVRFKLNKGPLKPYQITHSLSRPNNKGKNELAAA
jgi:hypothetical protein